MSIDPFAQISVKSMVGRLAARPEPAHPGEPRAAAGPADAAAPAEAAASWYTDRRGEEGPPPSPEAEFTFGDLIDILNPLQQLPLINIAYRELVDDPISPHARVMGGLLYGGISGGVGAVVNAVVEQASGKDIPSNMIAFALGRDDDEAGPDGGTATVRADDAEPIVTAGGDPTGVGAQAARAAATDDTLALAALAPPPPGATVTVPIARRPALAAAAPPPRPAADRQLAAAPRPLDKPAPPRPAVAAPPRPPAVAPTATVVPPPPDLGAEAASPLAPPGPGGIAETMLRNLEAYRRMQQRAAGGV